MNDQGLIQYLFPLLFFILYFVLNRPKKKQTQDRPLRKERKDPLEERRAVPKRLSLPPTPPPDVRTLPTLSSRIEARVLKPSLEKTPTLTSMNEPLLSPEFSEIGQKQPPRRCRGNRILQKLPTLQDAFVIREIFRRIDE